MDNVRKTRFVLFFAIVFILIEFFGWKYVGPISLRNIGLLLVVIALIKGGWKYDPQLFKRYRFLVIYYVFVCLLGFFNGLYLDKGTTLVFARFLPSVVLFCFITFSIKDKRYFSACVYLLLTIVIIDALVTILQGVGSSVGWAIYSYFHDPEMANDALSNYSNVDSSIGLSIASGITGTVVANGFFLTSLGLLFWYPFYEKRTTLSFVFSMICFFLCLVALFYNQQRAAFYVYLLLASIIMIFIIPSKKQRFVYLIVIAVMAFAFVLYNSQSLNTINVGRLENVTNEDIAYRHERHREFYSEFLPSHFLTGDRYEYGIQYGQTPHNMIIETLLLGGIIGLIIYLLYIVSLGVKCIGDYFKKNRDLVLFAIPVFSIILISWEHSYGLHTGYTLGACLIALYEKSIVCNENS